MFTRARGPSRILIYLRFARYLLWEFRWPIGVLVTLVLGGGLVMNGHYHRAHLPFSKACYTVFLMIFMQPSVDFPDEWYLQPLFFALPIVGLGAVADSVVRLAYLVFARKQNLPEWQRMVASLYRNHVVVVGLGRVGFQVVKGLLHAGEQVVAVELKAQSPWIEEVNELGVPIIHGDGRSAKVLAQAGVPEARSVILATSDDLANLDAGLSARDLNAAARVVLRLFDESLAHKVAGAFAMPTISTSQVAAPAFVAAATGRKVYQEFQLAGLTVHITDMMIHGAGSLVGQSVGDVQRALNVNIVVHHGPERVNINPAHEVTLCAGDTVLVIAPMERLIAMEARNHPARNHERAGAGAATSPGDGQASVPPAQQ